MRFLLISYRIEEFDYRMTSWAGKQRKGRGTSIGSIGSSAALNAIKWDQAADPNTIDPRLGDCEFCEGKTFNGTCIEDGEFEPEEIDEIEALRQRGLVK